MEQMGRQGLGTGQIEVELCTVIQETIHEPELIFYNLELLLRLWLIKIKKYYCMMPSDFNLKYISRCLLFVQKIPIMYLIPTLLNIGIWGSKCLILSKYLIIL